MKLTSFKHLAELLQTSEATDSISICFGPNSTRSASTVASSNRRALYCGTHCLSGECITVGEAIERLLKKLEEDAREATEQERLKQEKQCRNMWMGRGGWGNGRDALQKRRKRHMKNEIII